MTASKPANLVEVERMMAGWTLLQRVRFAALEMRNLTEIMRGHEESAVEAIAFDDICMGEYDTAIRRCDGDWEPPDPPGWEGGFAENH